MTHQAVLFDLDGTLANTLDDLADAMNWTLAQFALPTHPPDSYRHKVGDGVLALARRSLPADRQELAERIIPFMRQRYGEHMFDTTRLYEGVPELLDALADRPVRTAVLSNKPHEATVHVVRTLMGRWSFDAVRGVTDGGPIKPDPAGALALAAELDVPPAQWLYLGDTNTDIRTAVAAGMFPVGALWGFRDAAELTEAGARALIARPTDLLALV